MILVEALAKSFYPQDAFLSCSLNFEPQVELEIEVLSQLVQGHHGYLRYY